MNDSEISINVYDIKGGLVDRLKNGIIESGHHQIEWVPKNISSGIYVVSFDNKGMIINKKLTFLK